MKQKKEKKIWGYFLTWLFPVSLASYICGKCYLNLRWIDPQSRLGWQCLHLFCRKKSLKGCCNLSQWGAIFGKWAAITLQQHSSTQHCVLKDILGISNKKLNHKFNGIKSLLTKIHIFRILQEILSTKHRFRFLNWNFLCEPNKLLLHTVYMMGWRTALFGNPFPAQYRTSWFQ